MRLKQNKYVHILTYIETTGLSSVQTSNIVDVPYINVPSDIDLGD